MDETTFDGTAARRLDRHARKQFTFPTTADYLKATDGLPARPSGAWAKEKLFYLAYFMGLFTAGMKNRWLERLFIDLMTGPGLCRIKETSEEFSGSPLLALSTKVPFTKVFLVESDPLLARALQVRVADSQYRPEPIIRVGDCNDLHVISEIRGHLTRGTLGFAFVDLLGFNVRFDTLRRLTADRPVDLLITMPEMDFTRNAVQAMLRGDDARWTAFFGTNEWKEVVENWVRREKAGEVLKIALMRLYLKQLRTIEYRGLALNEPMRSQTGAALYRPLFASKHDRGLDFWRKACARNSHRQGTLF